MATTDYFNRMRDIGIVKNYDSITLDNISEIQKEIKNNIASINEDSIYLNQSNSLSGFMDPIYLNIPDLCDDILEVSDEHSFNIKSSINFGARNGTANFHIEGINSTSGATYFHVLQYKFIRIVEHYYITLGGVDNFFIPVNDLLLLFKKPRSKYNINKDIRRYLLPLNDVRISCSDLNKVSSIKDKKITPLRLDKDIYINIQPIYTFIRKKDSTLGFVESLCGVKIKVGNIWGIRYKMGQIFNGIPARILTLSSKDFMLARYFLYRIKLDDPNRRTIDDKYSYKVSTLLRKYYLFDTCDYQKQGNLYKILPSEHNKNNHIKDFIESILKVSNILYRERIIERVDLLRYNSHINIVGSDAIVDGTAVMNFIGNKRSKMGHKGILFREFCGDVISLDVYHKSYRPVKSSKIK